MNYRLSKMVKSIEIGSVLWLRERWVLVFRKYMPWSQKELWDDQLLRCLKTFSRKQNVLQGVEDHGRRSVTSLAHGSEESPSWKQLHHWKWSTESTQFPAKVQWHFHRKNKQTNNPKIYTETHRSQITRQSHGDKSWTWTQTHMLINRKGCRTQKETYTLQPPGSQKGQELTLEKSRPLQLGGLKHWTLRGWRPKLDPRITLCKINIDR